eukprot:TRINITY_DN53037_c0_g1_i1.p1 TRINITY_DN53037_c0_g1~~TRINITY_DN53037_c0_g1_i1.p1  ORF type:complete len:158 (-),score=29.28 TRINITY_DN53037_c0_g1_i1:95-568(-)
MPDGLILGVKGLGIYHRLSGRAQREEAIAAEAKRIEQQDEEANWKQQYAGDPSSARKTLLNALHTLINVKQCAAEQDGRITCTKQMDIMFKAKEAQPCVAASIESELVQISLALKAIEAEMLKAEGSWMHRKSPDMQKVRGAVDAMVQQAESAVAKI